jgi:hypothetical protein
VHGYHYTLIQGLPRGHWHMAGDSENSLPDRGIKYVTLCCKEYHAYPDNRTQVRTREAHTSITMPGCNRCLKVLKSEGQL